MSEWKSISEQSAGPTTVVIRARSDEYDCTITRRCEGKNLVTTGRGRHPCLAAAEPLRDACAWGDSEFERALLCTMVRAAVYVAEDAEAPEAVTPEPPSIGLKELIYRDAMTAGGYTVRTIDTDKHVATVYPSLIYDPRAYAKLFAGSVTLLEAAREVVDLWHTKSGDLNVAIEALAVSTKRATA